MTRLSIRQPAFSSAVYARRPSFTVLSGLFVMALAMLALTGGCRDVGASMAEDSGSKTFSATALDLPQRNIDQWVLPLDPYTRGDPPLELFAVNSGRDRCLRDKGHDLPPLYAFNVDGPRAADISAEGIRFFNLSIAQKYGYTPAPDPRRSSMDADAYNEVVRHKYETDPVFAGDMDTCNELANRAISAHGNSNPLGSDMSAQATRDALGPDVTQAMSRWHECMLQFGIPDLPSSPTDMPTQTQMAEWGPMPEVPDQVSGVQEIADAVKDAQCRQSSGYTQALYDATWDAQVKLMQQHVNDLPAMKEMMDARWELITQVARQYRP